jgi:hypothetical protein
MTTERTASKISKIVEKCMNEIISQIYVTMPKNERSKIIRTACRKHSINEAFIRKIGEWELKPRRLY